MSARHAARRVTALVATLAMGLAPAVAFAKPKPAPAPAAPATLVIYSTTVGAIVEIDGREVGRTPLEDGLAVEPGQHTIRVWLRGWSEHQDTFVAEAGQEVELEIDLIPQSGIVRIATAEPGATVAINGKVEGQTPFDRDVTVGKTVITVSRPGYFDAMRTLQIAAGQAYDLDITLEPMPDAQVGGPAGKQPVTSKWWFWTALGVAVAGGATALALALTSEDAQAPRPSATFVIP